MKFTNNALLDALIIATGAFVVTWSLRFLWRMVEEPTLLYYEKKEQADAAQAQLKAAFEPKYDTWLYDAVFYLVLGNWPAPGDRLLEPIRDEEGTAEERLKNSQRWDECREVT